MRKLYDLTFLIGLRISDNQKSRFSNVLTSDCSFKTKLNLICSLPQAHFDPQELFRQIFGEFSRGYRNGGGRGGFQDIFEDFSPFGFGSAAQETLVNLTFQQAARGITKEIEIIQASGSAR